MQQFWINQDGVQQGPLSLDQLRDLGVKPEAYVWCTGMPDWLPVSQVPEVAALVVKPEPAAPVADEPIAVADEPAAPVVAQQMPELPEAAQQPAAMPAMPAQQPAQPMPQQPAPQQPMPEMPPTNIGWAIGATLLCCIPLGIVAIIYSNKVSTSYYNGDMRAAEHYSEVSAWWCIATIVLGIISQPFITLLSM